MQNYPIGAYEHEIQSFQMNMIFTSLIEEKNFTSSEATN